MNNLCDIVSVMPYQREGLDVEWWRRRAWTAGRIRYNKLEKYLVLCDEFFLAERRYYPSFEDLVANDWEAVPATLKTYKMVPCTRDEATHTLGEDGFMRLRESVSQGLRPYYKQVIDNA